jgi:pyruvate carboxylase
VKDKAVKSLKAAHVKISGPNDVGAPLQGSLLKILVKEGEEVEKDTPLFVIEAMKMETTVCTSKKGVVSKILLNEKSMVEQDDCIIQLQ